MSDLHESASVRRPRRLGRVLGGVAGERRRTRRRATGGGSRRRRPRRRRRRARGSPRSRARAAARPAPAARARRRLTCTGAGDERSEGSGGVGWAAASVTSSCSPPMRALSSSAVPSAITRPWSMTEIVSASASASSRYCVVSSRVVPSADQRADDVPHAQPARRVEAGGRLVEEEHRRAGHEAGGEVEAAAHAAGVRLHHAVGGVGELELLEQLRGPGRWRPAAACSDSCRPARGSGCR